MTLVWDVVQMLRDVEPLMELVNAVDPYEEREDVDKKGTVNVIVGESGSWYRNESSALFPRVVVDVHADSTRNGDGRVTKDDARQRAEDAMDVIESKLHRTTRETVTWGDSWVLGSEKEDDRSWIARPGDGPVQLRIVFNLKVA